MNLSTNLCMNLSANLSAIFSMNLVAKPSVKVALSLALLLGPLTSYGQTSTSQSFRRNAATVIFWGLGGAVLGLSTLSFYGKPQEHISNIYVGLGAGLMAGTGFVYYRSLPQADYQDQQALWGKPVPGKQPIQFVYAWHF